MPSQTLEKGAEDAELTKKKKPSSSSSADNEDDSADESDPDDDDDSGGDAADEGDGDDAEDSDDSGSDDDGDSDSGDNNDDNKSSRKKKNKGLNGETSGQRTRKNTPSKNVASKSTEAAQVNVAKNAVDSPEASADHQRTSEDHQPSSGGAPAVEVDTAKVAATTGVAVARVEYMIGKSKVDTKDQREGAKFSLKDSSGEVKYPINDCSDVSDAWKLRGKSSIPKAKVESYIKRAAAKLNCDGPWNQAEKFQEWALRRLHEVSCPVVTVEAAKEAYPSLAKSGVQEACGKATLKVLRTLVRKSAKKGKIDKVENYSRLYSAVRTASKAKSEKAARKALVPAHDLITRNLPTFCSHTEEIKKMATVEVEKAKQKKITKSEVKLLKQQLADAQLQVSKLAAMPDMSGGPIRTPRTAQVTKSTAVADATKAAENAERAEKIGFLRSLAQSGTVKEQDYAIEVLTQMGVPL